MTWESPRRYDLVVSCSTIEHIGWDDQERCPERILNASNRLRALLAPAGQAVISVPLGINSGLDDAIARAGFGASELHFMKRVSQENLWKETDKEAALQCKYGDPYHGAGAILVAVYR